MLHGHCHQKAMGLLAPAKALLSRIPQAAVVDLDAGCCGMAGSFGYVREHFDVSRAIGERRLLPAARRLERDAVLVASGVSCRHQVADFAGPCAASGGAPRRTGTGDRMNLAVLSVGALALAIIVSCVTTLNVGVLAIALAWIVGVYVGGMPVDTVMAGFPTQLFLTLTGVTLLFTLAQCNGTLDRLAHHAVRAVPRQPRRHPDHVLPARRRPRVDGPGQHRDRRAARADGDGDGRPRPASRSS